MDGETRSDVPLASGYNHQFRGHTRSGVEADERGVDVSGHYQLYSVIED